MVTEDETKILDKFTAVVMCLIKFNATCKEKNAYLCNNNLFYEVLYWAIDIVLDNGRKISDGNIEKYLSISIMQNVIRNYGII